MKRIRNLIVILLVCSMLLGSLPISAATSNGNGKIFVTGYYKVTPVGSGLNVRKGPGTGYNKYDFQLYTGDFVYNINNDTGTTANNHKWIKVRVNGVTGWIAAMNLKPIEYNITESVCPNIYQGKITQPKNNAQLPKGKACHIKGYVQNFTSKKVYVIGRIYNQAQKCLQYTSKVALDPSKGFNLYNSVIDNGLSFGKLAATKKGEYYVLCVDILDASNNKLKRYKVTFTVK